MSFDSSAKKVCIVVLGDIGRSPRMQYHALSFAKSNYSVDLIGYGGTKPSMEILSNEKIKIKSLVPMPDLKFPRMINYVLKTLWQFCTLLFTISFRGKYDFVLCQNPPAIPTLLICWLYCFFTKAKFVIDWHNYAHTIMELTHSKDSFLVRVATKFEFFFGSLASANLCVTSAMRKDLLLHHGIIAETLYDRPPEMFRPITLEEKHNFLKKLSLEHSAFAVKDGETSDDTILTQCKEGTVMDRPDRPGVIFSSTSWTHDEDFEILFQALKGYDKLCREDSSYPKLICVITGKGPLKEFYTDRMSMVPMKHVEILTPWLEAADYPLMVSSADLGVSLHTSSSGLDLPMKVVDMFGAGLPVCAFKYPCLNELVKVGENGYTFENSEQLLQHIQGWFSGYPNNKQQNEIINQFKRNLNAFQELRWQRNWDRCAKPLFS